MPKIGLGIDVLTAARQRISRVFDDFPRIYLSFSGGKDSSVMLHLVMDEAIKRNRKIGVLFVDLEAQYKLTIEHIEYMYSMYSANIEPFWVSLPLNLRNAVSQFEPEWLCWDPKKRDVWVREPSKLSIVDEKYFPFFKRGMEFEELVPDFGDWYSQGKLTACFVGIRSDESLNRYRTIARKKSTFDGLQWTTWVKNHLYNAYPIYDWRTSDIWTYFGKFNKRYNRLYDSMHKAGLTIHQARICQPYGDDQRRGLWLYHVIEPETWAKLIKRVNGANQGALYCKESGNIMGQRILTKPDHLTWKQFSHLILDSLPPTTADHYRDKITMYLKYYKDKGFDEIPDEGGHTDKDTPSWTRICKALLRNDYWCKGLSFSPNISTAYTKYKKLMKRRRNEWGLI